MNWNSTFCLFGAAALLATGPSWRAYRPNTEPVSLSNSPNQNVAAVVLYSPVQIIGPSGYRSILDSGQDLQSTLYGKFTFANTYNCDINDNGVNLSGDQKFSFTGGSFFKGDNLFFNGASTINNGAGDLTVATVGNIVLRPTGIITGTILAAGTVNTTDATVTTCYSIVPTADKAIHVHANVVGNGTASNCSYELGATFKTVGAVVTQISSTAAIYTREENVAANATLDTDGTNIRVRITGIAATNMSWNAFVNISYAP
jgi:hypothetical protein